MCVVGLRVKGLLPVAPNGVNGSFSARVTCESKQIEKILNSWTIQGGSQRRIPSFCHRSDAMIHQFDGA